MIAPAALAQIKAFGPHSMARFPLRVSLILPLLLTLVADARAQSRPSPCDSADGSRMVSAVHFRGLDRTDPDFLHAFLETQSGRRFRSHTVRADVRSLRNMAPVRSASVSSTPSGRDSCVVTFTVTEYDGRLPYVNFGGVTDNFWFQVGGIDTHWLGRGFHTGVYYRYDDRHSFGLYQSLPYLFGHHWGLAYSVDRLATREPAFFGTRTVSYDVSRISTIGLLRYDLVHHLGSGKTTAIEFGGGVLWEHYERQGAGPGPLDRRFRKELMKAHVFHQRLQYDSHEQSGFATETKLQTIKTGTGPFNYWTLLNIVRGYIQPFRNVNWAVRLRTGLATNRRSPFVPFVLDNYVNVRGAGNTVARGTAELTLNVEHRHTLSTWSWGAVQGVGFVDLSGWRPGGHSLGSLFKEHNTVGLGGVGLRIHFRRVYPLTLRVDYGINPLHSEQRGPVIGIGQYF